MSWRRVVAAIARAGLDLLAPPTCAACAVGLEGDQPFCASCELALAPRDPWTCAACGRPLRVERRGEALCRGCARRLAPLCGADAAFDYEGPIARALQRLKYEGHDELAAPIVQRWALELSLRDALPGPGALLVPVPLHVHRLRARGFDQAWSLARALARRLRADARPRALRRARATRPQVGLGRAAREANVRAAFIAGESLAGREVVLIDDVLTTGATLVACARAATEAGARSVRALVLARAQP